MDHSAHLNSALEELNRSFNLPPYEAFDVAWIAVVKIANLLPGRTEHERMLALLDILSENSLRSILHKPEVDTLLELDPPLESILSAHHERLDKQRTADELKNVRSHRADDPKLALRNLAEVLKRIRNRRAHGFKTPQGPRDAEILGSGVWIIRLIGMSAAEAMGAK